MKKDYPPQTGRYMVKVNTRDSTDNWQDFDTARLQISVGQEYHEGDKISALISWCNNRFGKTVICVNDTLQRFNLMAEKGISDQEAKHRASTPGREWLKRNDQALSKAKNAKPIHWDEWLSLTEFKKGRLATEWLYTNNTQFKNAIDQNIDAIWQRRTKTNPELYTDDRFSNFFNLSKLYLLEEATVFSMMFEKEAAIDIYPGTTLFAATLFKGKDVKGAPPGLGKGHFCRIDLKRNKNFELE